MLLLALTAVRNNMIEWKNIKRITYLLTVMTKKAYLYWHAWMNEWKPVWLVLPNYNIATAICGYCLATLLLWLLLLLPIDDDDDDNFLFLLLWITCNEEEIKHSSIFLSFIPPHYQLFDSRDRSTQHQTTNRSTQQCSKNNSSDNSKSINKHNITSYPLINL